MRTGRSVANLRAAAKKLAAKKKIPQRLKPALLLEYLRHDLKVVPFQRIEFFRKRIGRAANFGGASSACGWVRCPPAAWSCKLEVMRLPVSFASVLATVAMLAVCSLAHAQVQSTTPPASPNGTYIAVNPLAGVHYDNRFDLSVGLAYDHMKAGPTLLQGSNLGGLDVSGSYWFSRNWAVEGSGRGYLGTSGAAPNTLGISGPFVSQYIFVGGPEWLGPHNQHGALIAHAMFGGAYGDFEKDLRGDSPSVVDFYSNQVAPAAIIGGHIDLNRSARWVFRITPDAVVTHYYSVNASSIKSTQWDVNFAISVGAEYRFKKRR